MSAPVLPETPLDQIRDLERRLGILERTAQPASSLGPSVTIPASRVTAEAFPSGAFTFPGDLTVTGSFRATTSVGTGLYVRPSSAVVEVGRYLDFHQSGVADEAADHNARFNCWSTGDMDLSGVNFHVVSGHITAEGVGKFGIGAHGASFCTVAHASNLDTAGAYAFLLGSNATYLNAPSTGTLYVRQDNATRMTVTNDVRTNVEHFFSKWVRSDTYGFGWFHQAGGGGWQMQDTTWVRVYGGKGIYADNGINGILNRVALIRRWGSDTYASFGHSSSVGYGGHPYGHMMSSAGECWIGANNFLRFYVDGGHLMQIRFVSGFSEVLFPEALPAIAGNTAIINTGNYQLGFASSSLDAKENLRDLEWVDDAAPNDNPVFRFRVRRFHWRPGKVANAEEVNAQHPDGIVGLVAEEVAAAAPDAVHWQGDREKVTGVDERAMMGYVVAGLQHCHRGLDRRVTREDGLEARIAAIEAIPAIAAVIEKENT